MLPPFFVLFCGRPTARKLAGAGVASLFGILALSWIFRWLGAPYHANPTAFMMTKLLTLDVNWQDFLELVVSNVSQLLGRSSVSVERTLIDEQWTVLAVAGVMTGLFALGRKRVAFLRGFLGERPGFALFCFYNQAVIIVATVVTYYVGNGGGLRIFSIHLLLTVFVAAGAPQRALRFLVISTLAYNLMTMGPCLATVNNSLEPCFSRAKSTADFRQMVEDLVVFDPAANGWDNTVLVDGIPAEFCGFAPGIGVSLIIDTDVLRNPKSRYIIATAEEIAYARPKVRLLRNSKGSARSTAGPRPGQICTSTWPRRAEQETRCRNPIPVASNRPLRRARCTW